MLKKILKYFFVFLLILVSVYFIFFNKKYPITVITHSFTPGDSLDSFNGVAVYNNGASIATSHGKHYSVDSSCYYGKKWQCVEFIKRYYYDHLHFKFTDGFGNAKDFFDKETKQGQLNKRRGLVQFINGLNEKPKVDDILVFDGSLGHVAIVTHVTDDEVEVIQQNIYMTPRQTFVLKYENRNYTIGEDRKPFGWLRLRKDE